MKTKSALLFLAFAFCTNTNIIHAQVSVQDSLALLDLYNSTNGPNWRNHTNWLTKSPVSTWHGVSVWGGNVYNLNLGQNKLSGSIPPSIGNLTNLYELNLSNNQLRGTIPSSLVNLDKLMSLDLSYNQLSGTVPSFHFHLISDFTDSPSWLGLNNNLFTYDGIENDVWAADYVYYSPQAPIALHQNGNSLSVYAGGTLINNTYKWFSVERENDFITIVADSVFHPSKSGHYFAAITNPACSELTLYTDTILFTPIHNIHGDSLALVDLYSNTDGPNWKNRTNWLTASPVSTWYGITVTDGRVTGISLESNGLNGSISSSIDYLENLSYLRFDGNNLRGSIPPFFNYLPHSLSMNLSDNHFTFDGMELIAQKFPNAIYAPQKPIPTNQNDNVLSVSAGGTLGKNTYKWFSVDQNDSVTITGDSGFYVSTMGKYFAKITNTICTQLTLYADTVYNDAAGVLQDSLALVDLYNSTDGSNWKNHTNWLTKNPKSTWYGIETVNGRVTGIALGDNNLKGGIPSSIGDLVNLTALRLYYNQISGTIPSSVGNLVKLTSLSLGGNQLTGSIPFSIGNLVNLASLDLYFNQLSDSFPSFIGNLRRLAALDLSLNKLSGSIPSSIGNVVRLKHLNLGANKLSGAIPASMTNLTSVFEGYDGRDGTGGGFINLGGNYFTFEGMEAIAIKFGSDFLSFGGQANIPIHQNGKTLYVSAGGTLRRNTYKWFSIEQNDTVTIVGDSVFHPSKSGHYFASVNNAYCYDLTLRTDTIFYDAALPVTIINLKAQQQKSIIKIDWTSVTEINVASYEVQRSSNALNFNTIGSLTAKDNGTEKVNYTFNDVQPMHGDNYYRIKAVDKDGKTTYSNTVLVNMVNDKIITIVYPNPAKDILHVETNGSTTFSLINQSGEILLTTNINGKGIINVSGISGGLYYLKNNSTGNVQRVIITR